MKIVESIIENKIVAIIRRIPMEFIYDTALALKNGGIHTIEVTFDQSSETCIEDAVKAISLLKNNFGSNLNIGAGTVLNRNQVDAVAHVGADFILSPDTNPEVITQTKKHNLTSIPGALTPSEIVVAWNTGADIVKLFPASNFGIPYIKAIKGPISHIPLMAVGGINIGNVRTFLDSGYISCGVGSSLVRNDLIFEKKFEELQTLTNSFVIACK
ncbi:bifunctional 4-hydroxy-2-oxoglutarate aldolase/2-dehydro-3-deoxy-phosphogluconate aldolase [uncultured Sphaerochaeta sp.]|uniref:bifunctional 4-hydroxy-2-oxoglutarate aldolase/2-dehydro-3-deoxy-phosphogluconate aldolase n=1 Tax=uncultured Sphaerochaeta sp. TaxID=886478 RepID=UPI002AA5E998|nr:bifunctional 4-hydroxy-2-oxoglutarate aldolase/2-dehydro-3-deoxy-phosphogluconate aldolase [uncultured Sphaerochaeta sp.]